MASDGLGPAVVSLDSVAKHYGSRVAVDGVDLEVGAGEMLALLGPSGGGKTTILRLIAGFTQPSAGTVRLGGEDVTYRPAHRRGVGVVFQNYALFPHMTVAGNVAYGLRVRRWRGADIRRRTEEVLKLVHLEDCGDLLPSQLSGGQQQRVALARALAFHPDVLLMDEPLSNLDANLRQEVGEEIRRLQRATRTTAILVTHDRHEAFALADRVAILDQGRIVQTGAAADLYRRPLNQFIARFVGPANLIPADVTSVDAGSADLLIQGQAASAASPAGLANGQAVRVLVRPEDLRILRPGDSADTRLAVQVTDVLYYGDFATALLKAGSLELHATVRGKDLAGIDRGAQLQVGWARGDAWMLVE